MISEVEFGKNIIESAKIAACKIDDETLRKQAYALNIAAAAAADYFQENGLNAETKCSLFKIPAFIKDFEFADLYINGLRLDIRLTFDGETFTVPVSHKALGLEPSAYVVMKLDSFLSSAQILGFVPSAELTTNLQDETYRFYEVSVLKNIEGLQDFIDSTEVNIGTFSAAEHEKIKETCTAFLDDEITDSDKIAFVQHILACPVCRETLCDMSDFDIIVSQVKNYHDLLNDSTLSVFAGNKQEFDFATLESLALVENAEENIQKETDEVAEETSLDNTESAVVDEGSNGINIGVPVVVPVPTPIVGIPPVVAPVPVGSLNVDLPDVDLNLDSDGAVESLDLNNSDAEGSLENNENQQQENTDNDNTDTLLNEENELSLDEINTDNEDVTLTNSESLDSVDKTENISIEDVPVEETQFASDSSLQESFEEIQPLDETENLEELSVEDVQDTLTDITPEESLIHDEIKELTEVEPLNEDIVQVEEIEELQEVEGEHLEEINSDTSVAINDISDTPISNLEPMDELQEVEAEPLEELPVNEDVAVEDKTEMKNEDDSVSLDLDDLEVIDGLGSDELLTENSLENDTVSEESLTLDNKEIETDLSSDENEAENFSQPYNEPIELDYDEETNDEKSVNDATDTEAPASTEEAVTEENDEIQNLLDDDLMALLSQDEDGAESQQNSEAETVEQETAVNEEQTASQDNEDIKSLFENPDSEAPKLNPENFELAQEPVSEKTVKTTKKLAVLIAILAVLGIGSVGTWFVNHQKAAQAPESIGDEGMLDMANGTAQNGTDTQSAAVSQDINKSMANSFSDKPAAITITKISWQVSEKLATESSVKEYLQTAGKNIQMNLQNDLANAADVAFNNKVKLSVVITPDNTIKGAQMLESSGSDKIDDTILRSVKNTLKYISVPKLKNFKSDYFLTLIINF